MEAMTETEAQSAPRRNLALRLLPLAVLLAGAAAFFGLGLHDYLSFETLRENRVELTAWVQDRMVLAALAIILLYAATTVFIPPSGTVMTVAGGFVFGAVAGTVYVVIGATIGATALFLTARFVLGDGLRARAGTGIRKMEAGFRENALSYMLILRLVPLFPFWLVNLAPAFLGVRLRTYVVGTFAGIIPGTAVYATFGAGLGSIFDSNRELTLSGVLTPEIVAGLVGLALLAFIPVVYKRIKGGRN
jgi:uncharacterized membrane protein YdjX (TVP38/TMEM64 family)